jgi:hypothetical protein
MGKLYMERKMTMQVRVMPIRSENDCCQGEEEGELFEEKEKELTL